MVSTAIVCVAIALRAGERAEAGADPRIAVLAFGLVHGLGLATKLLEAGLSRNGAEGNMLAFNIGVELGQFAALAMILVALQLWRHSGGFQSTAYAANVAIMGAGFVIFGYQVAGLPVSAGYWRL